MDVLEVGPDAERVVLRRYRPPEPGEVDPAVAETRVLILAADRRMPAPVPMWRDRKGLLTERAAILGFLEGSVLLQPEDHLDWAGQLASMLVAIHRIRPGEDDLSLFPLLAPGEDDHVSDSAVIQHPSSSSSNVWWELRRVELPELRSVEPVYIHHDYWAGNTLWQDGRLVAVVDWEGRSIGDPAIDVANCAFDMRMPDMDRAADQFIRIYRQPPGDGWTTSDTGTLRRRCPTQTCGVDQDGRPFLGLRHRIVRRLRCRLEARSRPSTNDDTTTGPATLGRSFHGTNTGRPANRDHHRAVRPAFAGRRRLRWP